MKTKIVEKNKLKVSVQPVLLGSAKHTQYVQSEFLTAKEAAEMLNLKISRIRNLVFKKKIPFVKIGSTIRLSKHELQKWIESQSVGQC